MPGPDLSANLSAIAAARAQVAANDDQRRDLGVRLADLAAERDRLLATGAPAEHLRTVEERLRAATTQRHAADERRGSLLQQVGDLSDQGITLFIDPAGAVSTLAGDVPIALLPVRVETRYADGNTTLHVRVFPDQIHVDDHDPALTEAEVSAGRNYWTHRWPDLADTHLADEAWKAMTAGFRPGRGRYVVDRLQPSNTPADGEPAFPDVERRAAGWSRAATATALPDRVAVLGFRRVAEGQYEQLFVAWGSGVPDRLQVGPAPDPGSPDLSGGLPKDEGLAWLHDPQAAIDAGMLITVRDAQLAAGHRLADGVDRLLVVGVDWTLDPDAAAAALAGLLEAQRAEGRLADGVDRLLVVGVDWTLDPDAAAAALAGLLEAQRAEGRLGFVAQGTPTNNTGDRRSGWTSDRAALAAALDPAAPAPAYDDWSAGRRAAAALGLPAGALDAAPGAGSRELRWASALTDALWRATAGYYLVDLLDPVGSDPQNDADLRDHVAAHLFAGGPLPTLRVGPQPYGVLPVVARRRYAARASVESTVLRVASVLRELVEPLVASVPQLRRAGEPQQVDDTLLALLQRTPVPWAFAYRHAVGPVQRKAMSVYWDRLAAFQGGWTAVVWSRLHTYRLTRLSELTLDPDNHPLRVPLVRKGADAGAGYLAEIRALLADDQGRLALNVREDSEALLEALAACAAVRELDRVAARKVGDVVAQVRPDLVDTLAVSRLLNVPTPDTVRVAEPDPAAAPFAFATPRELADAVLPAVDPAHPLAVVAAREFAGIDLRVVLGAPTDPQYWLARFATALDDLAGAPPEELEWALRGFLDLFTARLDAWWTSLAHRRLTEQREGRPTGVHVGCWGWVEDLHPAASRASLGYVHTPSLAQAATAAVLRSGRQAHQGDAAELFDIELTAARTREALGLLHGVARGQRLAALLGYRLERRLQEAGPTFARYVWHLRTLAPMRSDEAAADTPSEAIAAHDVVDALTLLERWRTDRAGVLAAADVAAADQDTVSGILDAVAGAYDAVSDVLVAEAVHQAAQGNLERSGAALAAHDRQSAAPDPDFVRTPRPGHTVAHRVGLLLQDTDPAPGWERDVRGAAEPYLDAWLGRVLGPASSYAVTGRVVRAGGEVTDLPPVRLDALGLGALSVVLAARRPGQDHPSELEGRLALAFGAHVADPAADDRIELLAEGPAPHPERGLGLLMALAERAAEVVAAAPFTGAELRPAGDPARSADDGLPLHAATPDVADLRARAAAVLAALGAAADGLAAGPTGTDLAAALSAAVPYDSDALPRVPTGHPDAATVLAAQAAEVAGRLAAVRAAAQAVLDAPGGADPDAEVARLRELVRALLGPAQPALPLLTVGDPGPVAASLADAAALTGGDPLAAVGWLHQHALVRPPLDPLAALLLHAEADGADVAGQLRVVQAPHRPGAVWCALPYGDTPPPHGTVAFLAHTAGPLDPAQPLAGVVVDTWAETIPAATETTAVSFHYDAPGSRAPQAVLLAVHPDLQPDSWDFATLVDTVQEAADLARLRTLTARELAPLGGFLPALYLPDDYTRDVPSVPLRKLAEIAAMRLGADETFRTNVLGKG